MRPAPRAGVCGQPLLPQGWLVGFGAGFVVMGFFRAVKTTLS